MITGAAITSGKFHFFGTQHWAVLLSIAVATAGLSYLVRRAADGPYEARLRHAICLGLALLLLGGAVHGEVDRVLAGRWSLRESLPLHLCDIGLLVCVATLGGVGRYGAPAIRRAFKSAACAGAPQPSAAWQYLYELAYVWGLGGTLQAVLTPDLQESFPQFGCVRYFVNHGGIIVAVLVLTIGMRMRPLPGAPRRVWLTTLGLAVVMLPVDWLLGANYMYLLGPPGRPSLIDYLGPWPWSLLGLVTVGTGLILLCYAPFWVLDRRR